MADEANTAVAAGGQTAVAQPGSPDTDAATDRSVERNRAEADDLSKVIGGTPGRAFDEPFVAPDDDDASAIPDDPAQAGHTDGTEATVDGPAANADPAGTVDPATGKPKQPAAADTLPGDDVISEFEGMTIPAEQGDPSKTTQADLTDEALDKIANPDGKAPLELQLKNVRSFVGKQSNDIGALRKEVEKRDGILGSLFERETGTPKVDAVISLTRALPPGAIDQALAKEGYRIVPLDWKGEADGGPEADLKSVVDKLLPGNDLTTEEKLAEINADPRKNWLMQDALAELKADRKAAKREAELGRKQTEAQKAAQSQEAIRQTQTWVETLKKLPHYKDIEPALRYYNKLIPSVGEGAITGKLRQDILYKLASFNRVPGEIKRMRTDLEKRLRAGETNRTRISGAMPGGNTPPMHIPGGGNGTAADAELATMEKEVKSIFG